MKKRVLLTGASGSIGSVLREHLRDEYEFVLFCRSKIENLTDNEKFIRGDVTDHLALEKAAQGVDVIVDMAAVADEKSFRNELIYVNVLGTYNIFEAARKAKLKKYVYASTHHTIGMYPAGRFLDASVPCRPDSMYGVTKCFAEAMGSLYADKTGMSVICLRIGAFRDRPLDERHLAVWLSPRDLVKLVRCSIEASDLHFEIFYGISNNTRKWWDIERARRLIGYDPMDNAEVYASSLLQKPEDEWLSRVKYQGSNKAVIPLIP